MSKAERGFMLATNDLPMPIRAAALQFPQTRRSMMRSNRSLSALLGNL
jgi:hypothetical protein